VEDPIAPRPSARLSTFRFILLAAACVATFAALTLPDLLRPSASPLNAGDISPRDYVAPSDASFGSLVLTEREKQAAFDSVQTVFSPPDPAISRQQMIKLRNMLDSITLTRANTTSTLDQKRTRIAALPGIALTTETIDSLLALSDERWNTLREESLTVLERVLRGVIRESDIETVRRGVPSLVSFSLNESEVALVSELVKPFVTANSLYSQELTEAARQAARDAVSPIVATYKAGETIVRAGERVSDEQVEALQELGLIRSGSEPLDLIGKGALTTLVTVFAGLYFYRRKRLGFLYEARSLLVVVLVYILFLVGTRLAVPGNVLLPYLVPLPAAGMLLATLFGMEAGIVISIITSVMAAYGFNSDLLPYYLFSSLCGVLALGSARRFWSYIWAGMAVTGAGIAILAAFRIAVGDLDWLGTTQLVLAATGNGFLSAALALLGQYFLAQSLGLATTLHLLDISRLDFPLLQFFLRNAPGTYQHSLQVANLAEQAAEAIGADQLLVRVGALFHDVGKAKNASFFIENQVTGHTDPHQDMDPAEAAATIIRHVTEGAVLARKHRLPRRIVDFMLEHHGTMVTRYQYNQALEKVNGDTSKVDIEKFRYPGPRPRSRETAILMLADGAEARARVKGPQTDDEMRALVRGVIEHVQKEGQLDHTMLTLRDLNTIVESFVTTLRGTYHPRIQYPTTETLSAVEPLATIPRKP
jgi:putative nucleotidyltransferase with HDIG domain